MMPIPDLKYTRLKDVAGRWSKLTGQDFDHFRVIEYIKQGKLRALVHEAGFYEELENEDLLLFDLSNAEIKGIDEIWEMSLCDIDSLASSALDDFSIDPCNVKFKNIYIDIDELRRIESGKEENDEHNKPLHPKENKSLHTLLLVFAKLSKSNINKPYSLSDMIISEAQELGLDISENTIKKFLKNALNEISREKQKVFDDF
jgi:hypothetical protein